MAEKILEIRTKVRMAQWQTIIKECKESGMSVTKLCEDRNISWHAYYYWLRKIREYITQYSPALPRVLRPVPQHKAS